MKFSYNSTTITYKAIEKKVIKVVKPPVNNSSDKFTNKEKTNLEKKLEQFICAQTELRVKSG